MSQLVCHTWRINSHTRLVFTLLIHCLVVIQQVRQCEFWQFWRWFRIDCDAHVINAWRVCIARTMLWQDVCPSVCLSVRHTPVLCLNDCTYPQNVFTILVFPYQTGRQYYDGPPERGRRMQVGMKNHDFRPKSRFISRMMQYRAILTMEGE